MLVWDKTYEVRISFLHNVMDDLFVCLLFVPVVSLIFGFDVFGVNFHEKFSRLVRGHADAEAGRRVSVWFFSIPVDLHDLRGRLRHQAHDGTSRSDCARREVVT